MPDSGQSQAPTLSPIVDHIISTLGNHRRAYLAIDAKRHPPPLFVGLQGPQGSGKSYLSALLPDALASRFATDRENLSDEIHPREPPATLSLHTAVLSLDDFYLPHSALNELAKQNALWNGRGEPGTHDLELGTQLFSSLKTINDILEPNEPSGQHPEVQLPVYDKSLHSGKGDRSSETVPVHAPLDVLIFEGWCVGFGVPKGFLGDAPSLPSEQASKSPLLEKLYSVPVAGLPSYDLSQWSSLDIMAVAKKLDEYETKWWSQMDVWIELAPDPSHGLSPIYAWRLQQEDSLKKKNEGRGMTDDEVKRFVDRYIPAYHFFLSPCERAKASHKHAESANHSGSTAEEVKLSAGIFHEWQGSGLKLVLGKGREVLSVEEF